MKYLILGANGQVGFELANACDFAGDVIALTREQVDFTRPGDVSRAIETHQPDVVINAVAYTAVDKAETEPSLAMLVNGSAVQEMARSCQKVNAWCVHYSTDYVFDGTGDTPYKETDAVNPLGIYGQTKLAGEMFLQQECEKHLILRTSWVYSWRGANFVKTMLRVAQQRDELNVVNDQFGCPSYATDIAHSTQQIVNQLKDSEDLSGIYHLTGNEPTSWCDFAKQIFSQANKSIQVNPIPTSEYPTPAKRPGYSILDNSKIKQTFAVEMPSHSQSLQTCLDNLIVE